LKNISDKTIITGTIFVYICLFIFTLILSIITSASARANDEVGSVQVAQLKIIMPEVHINALCDRGRTTVTFQNQGQRWAEKATLVALHPHTGVRYERSLILATGQMASFRLGAEQSIGDVFGHISAPWLATPIKIQTNLSCS